MRIEEVINETILAIYQEPKLAKKLVIKGGSALRLLEDINIRISTDLDLSIAKALENAKEFFPLIERSLIKKFKVLGYDVIDFSYHKKPKKRASRPIWWSGWLCTFKLSQKVQEALSKEKRSRAALVPFGSNSSSIEIEISEFEYCQLKQTRIINGVKVYGYSRELLVLEKIRALCQQAPGYRLGTSKNRARDLVDIYFLTKSADKNFFVQCQKHLKPVFEAKEVKLDLLQVFWEDSYTEVLRNGFVEIIDTVKSKINNFDVYLENLRFLILQIYPQANKF